MRGARATKITAVVGDTHGGGTFKGTKKARRTRPELTSTADRRAYHLLLPPLEQPHCLPLRLCLYISPVHLRFLLRVVMAQTNNACVCKTRFLGCMYPNTIYMSSVRVIHDTVLGRTQSAAGSTSTGPLSAQALPRALPSPFCPPAEDPHHPHAWWEKECPSRLTPFLRPTPRPPSQRRASASPSNPTPTPPTFLPETFTQALPSALLLSLVFGRVMPVVVRCVCVARKNVFIGNLLRRAAVPSENKGTGAVRFEVPRERGGSTRRGVIVALLFSPWAQVHTLFAPAARELGSKASKLKYKKIGFKGLKNSNIKKSGFPLELFAEETRARLSKSTANPQNIRAHQTARGGRDNHGTETKEGDGVQVEPLRSCGTLLVGLVGVLVKVCVLGRMPVGAERSARVWCI